MTPSPKQHLELLVNLCRDSSLNLNLVALGKVSSGGQEMILSLYLALVRLYLECWVQLWTLVQERPRYTGKSSKEGYQDDYGIRAPVLCG